MAVVVIGAGHAGVQAAESLRAAGYVERVFLLDKDDRLPYQRPPLSKDYMKPGSDPTPLPLRGQRFYADHDIELRTGVAASGIDARDMLVHTAAGDAIPYTDVIIAAGAEARRASCSGAFDLQGISYLRTVTDAEALRSQLDGTARRVVVVGAGFIGLEFAAVAAERGLDVTVIDFAQRPMQRVLSPSMSAYFSEVHEGLGVALRFDEGLAHFVGSDGHVSAVVGTSGTVYPCDFAVVGLGVTTDETLASSSGVACNRGILVDEYLRTNVPHIYAIGDLAVFPARGSGHHLRLESVQNATDMAKTVARTIATSVAIPYHATPWFWSHQGPAKLQIAGIADPAGVVVERGDRASGKFSQFVFHDDRLVAVESVNSPADHVAARKLLDHGAGITLDQARDQSFDVKAHAKALPSAV